jgi:mono/diheme cytochrome c family protein
MNSRLHRIAAFWAIPALLGTIAAVVGSQYLPESIAAQAARQSNMVPVRFEALKVNLPTSAALFPADKGSDIANANCLICHSAGMALRQPPLTVDEWRAEITKMKTAFGAPIPADQIDELADYLGTVDGRAGASQPGALDSQGN